jgi:Tripartite ATP-independent periplasmic transporter, DctM component
MLAPVAQKLGIDLVWFGVLLCVNLQTSFMHPPFGFALFYLRGIADTLFKDKRIPLPVKSSDIYLGSIPWVIMQLMLVAVVIFVPQTVTAFLDKEEKIDLDKVNIEVPADEDRAADPKPDAAALTGAAKVEAEKALEASDAKALADEQKKIDELFKK